jgi:hypothetical protein
MTKNTFTLLIWEEVPEDTKLFLIPNEDLPEQYREVFTAAQDKFINSDDDVDATNQICCMLGKPEHSDPRHLAVAGTLCCYQLDKSEPIVGKVITHVYYTGFML